MIVFDKVSKIYSLGTFELHNTTFQIDDNEFVFLVGPSGAGKTTILKLIIAAVTPTAGSIVVNDTTITDKRFKSVEKLRQSIGFVFQDFKMLFDKNIIENVAIALKVSGYSDKSVRDEADRVLKLVGLSEKKFMFPIQLSAGELQRAAIARAVVGRRSIILADEPTGNLDPKTSWEIMNIFKKLDNENKTVIIATHNVDIVNSVKKRVIVMKNGSIVKDARGSGYDL